MKAVRWISHRGYHKEHSENTLGAIRSAVLAGFRVIETDLRITSDDQIVLSHDYNLQRIAKIRMDVEKTSRADLEKVALPCGGRLMFLSQLLDEFTSVEWTFDLKGQNIQRLCSVLYRMVQDRNLLGWLDKKVQFVAWRSSDEDVVRQWFPMAHFYARERECVRAGLAMILKLPALAGLRAGKTYAITSSYLGVNLFQARIVNAYHQAGAKVVAFLPKNELLTLKAVEAGIDEILTDHAIPANADLYRPL